MAVFTLSAFLVIAVPWAVEPVDIPLPTVDLRVVESALAAEHARASAIGPVLAEELARGTGGRHFELRALGEALRAYGRAESAQDSATALERRRAVLIAAGKAREFGDGDLLALRAYQTDLFLQELRAWERRGTQSQDLGELGGSFLDLARRQGWLRKGGRIEMTEAERAVVFRRRWNEITGLAHGAFALSRDENRLLYRFLLTHPPRLVDRETGTSGHDAGAQENERAVNAWCLRKVEELAMLDPEYPRALARGVLLYQRRQCSLAAAAFREHLAGWHAGTHSLRARNYLKAAEERCEE